MINYDDSELKILSFYNISSLEPLSKEELNLGDLESIDADSINSLSTEDQFNLLNKLINIKTDHNHNLNYQYNVDDNEDPLRGKGSNVTRLLLQQGVVSSPDDAKLNQFLISSQSFDSQEYLKTVHRDTSLDELASSLRFLEKSIQSQNTQLKQVINENYIQFIDCKKSMDDILVWFREQKPKALQEIENSKVFNPQRHKDLGKNASLLSHLEQSIKNINLASSLVIRPIVEHKNKEKKLCKLMDFIKVHEFFFDLPNKLIQYLVDQNHDDFISDYYRYLEEKSAFVEEEGRKRKKLESFSAQNKDVKEAVRIREELQLIDTTLHRVFKEVDTIALEYRKKIHNELLSLDNHDFSGTGVITAENSKFISLVDKLYELNRNGDNTLNPIREFMESQLRGLEKDFGYQSNKFDMKFNSMQKKLADYMTSLADFRDGGSNIANIGDKYNSMIDYLKASSASTGSTIKEKESLVVDLFRSSENLDLSFINETWLILLNYIMYLDDLFLKKIMKFVQNYTHYNNGEKGFRSDPDGQIRNMFFALISEVSNRLFRLFNNEAENVNQLESHPGNYSQFLPYYTNSLSTVHYLSSISEKLDHLLTEFGTSVTLVGNISRSTESNKLIKALRSVSASLKQKIVEASCSVWVNDCSQFYDLENWETYNPTAGEKLDVTFTKTMDIFECYELHMLNKIAELVLGNQDRNSDQEDVRIVAAYPSKRVLVSIEIQFMRSLNIFIDSLMKKYAMENTKNANKSPGIEAELYKVLTMNNFDRLSRTTYPTLIKRFDKLFDKNLRQQNLNLYADMDKAALTILDDFLLNEKAWIDDTVSSFFLKVPTRVVDSGQRIKVEGFVYQVLVHFVKLVYIIRPLTGTEIFASIGNEIQHYFLKIFLDYVRSSQSENLKLLLNNLRLSITFFVEVFEPSKYLKLNGHSMKLVDVILDTIVEIGPEHDISDQEFDNILIESLHDSENEFASLL